MPIVYYDKNGRKSTKPPKGVSPFKPKPLVNGDGVSPEDGVPVKPRLDWEVRKRGKKS